GIYRLAEIDVVAVGREGQTFVVRCRRWDDLGITGSRYVTKPKTFLAAVILHAEDVVAIWRNGSLFRFAGVGDLRDGEVLEWTWAGGGRQCVKPEPGRAQQHDRKHRHQRRAETMLAHNCLDAGTGAMRGSNFACGDGDADGARCGRSELPARFRVCDCITPRTAVAQQAFQIAADFRGMLVSQI